jgi:hypothetical protein
VTGQPSYGVFRLFDLNSRLSIVHFTFGSMTVTSATAPGFNVPRSMPSTAAGLTVVLAISWGQLRWPGSTRCVTQMGRNVSSPTMPFGHWSSSRAFFSGACGAWSVASTLRVPSVSPARIASTSRWVRSGGAIL